LNNKKWFVLYIKHNFGKKIEQQCEKLDIEVFFPVITTIKKWSDRKKEVEVPIFPSYIFINGTEKERLQALSINGVVKSVMFNKEIATLRVSEIETIKRIIGTEKFIDTCNSISVGSKVKVISGPLTGVEGVLAEIKGKKVFSLVLETINSSILVDIPQDEIALIENLK
jgi:transcription antitermination factor NusG